MSKARKSRERARPEIELDQPPDEELARLLADAGDDDVVRGPTLRASARERSPDSIAKDVVEGTVGTLLSLARAESGRSLREIGDEAGVTRARIQQIESSENIEVATLVRFAGACGYEVRIDLRPLSIGKREFSVALPTPVSRKKTRGAPTIRRRR